MNLSSLKHTSNTIQVCFIKKNKNLSWRESMDWGKAFDKTLREYKISARWLSEQISQRGKSFSQQSISTFRNSKGPVTTDSLSLLLGELPIDAVLYFFSLVIGESFSTQAPEVEELAMLLPKERKRKLAIALVNAVAREPDPAKT
ncbi:MAG: hypothetical protein F6K47_15865 [Symploca sp. SIO2E6]|nr:hypothetical protein [Symploca sp. SIO2E6]